MILEFVGKQPDKAHHHSKYYSSYNKHEDSLTERTDCLFLHQSYLISLFSSLFHIDFLLVWYLLQHLLISPKLNFELIGEFLHPRSHLQHIILNHFLLSRKILLLLLLLLIIILRFLLFLSYSSDLYKWNKGQ